MLKYVIILFQSIWGILCLTYTLIVLTGKCIFYLVSTFLSTIIITVHTVVNCLNALYEEVAFFLTDINNRTTVVLQCIAEETTNNIDNISKLAAGVLSELNDLAAGGKQQLRDFADAIALAMGWSGKTLNGGLFFIGDTVWSTVRFIPHLIIIPFVLVYKLIASTLTLILFSIVKIADGLLRMPLQSLLGLVLIIAIFKFRHSIYILSRRTVIRICNNTYQIFSYRRRRPTMIFIYDNGLRQEVYEITPSLTQRVYIFARTALLYILNNIYQIISYRRPRSVAVHRGISPSPEPRNSNSYRCRSKPENPVNSNSFDNFCVICQENLKCVVLLPCKHLCLCEQCAERITIYQDTCPLCRICVRTKMSVFI